MWYYVQLIIDLVVCIFLFYYVFSTHNETKKQIDRLSAQLSMLAEQMGQVTEGEKEQEEETTAAGEATVTRLDFDEKRVHFSAQIEEIPYDLPEKENADE